MSARDVAVREGTIRLGQFLKLADLVDTGADAKSLLTEGRVVVNGEVETRRGRQLAPGDVVEVEGLAHPLGSAARVAEQPKG